MYELKKLRSDLKYVMEKLDYDEVDVLSNEDFIDILLGKTSQRKVIHNIIVNIINSLPTDLDNVSFGAYTTLYGHKDNKKIAEELAKTDERMAGILQDYIDYIY